ncbi:endoribonuclease Dicer-like protein 3a [Forsythia ovata]|uniref:Endoribonuclease Dicer-like protein 3a n=1 Tax=Forsythia ovata TaxID=205694 RepID=A0ABD1S8X6_9LAMI
MKTNVYSSLNTQTTHNTEDEIENKKRDLGRMAFMKYRLPLREIVVDFYTELKSITSGYASFDYEDADYEASDLVKLDILLNGQPVDAMATIVHRLKVQRVGREPVEKLKKFIDRQMFEITIQAAIGSKVIARETEVPVDNNFEDEKLVVGKTCDKGHRWMGSKIVSNCVEALLGAYYVGGGLTATFQLMKWLSIGAEVEPSWVDNAIKAGSLHSYTPKAKDIKILESIIGYEFSVKGLLLEAITHEHEQGVDYWSQHLYQSYPNVDPGELTDLCAASVSNDNFAIAAVKQNLYPHLQYGFLNLGSQISEFVKSTSDLSKTSILTQAIKAPKNFSYLETWRKASPVQCLLTPTLICITHGSGHDTKAAKGMAAVYLLKQLEVFLKASYDRD